MLIQPHSPTLWEASPARFKKLPDFGIKGPGCVHLWVKSSIRNIGEKFPKRSLVEPLFLVFLTKCLSKCPSSIPSPSKTLHLKCLTGF